MLETEQGLQEREKEREKWGLGQDQESVKLDMRQTVVESRRCRGLYAQERGGQNMERVKVGVTNRTWPIQDGEREKK